MSQPFRVAVVGAGPGDPGLVTLRALELLSVADIVFYDQLVSKRVLDFAPDGCELVGARELPGAAGGRTPLTDRMIDAARAGRKVVRLKAGDPLTFGRGGDEIEALRQAGVGYEIVPGVTAALAAAAFLELPLAWRTANPSRGAVALVTGHDLPSKPGQGLDWEALARFPGTLCVYMGLSRLPLIAQELLKFGRDPETPAGVVERASTGEMRSVFAPLKSIDSARRQAGLEAPGLIFVGEPLALKPEKSWFEARPLFGRRVLVVRAAHQSREMLRELEQLGAVALRLSPVEFAPPADWAEVDAAIATLADRGFDWAVFTSTNAVEALWRRLRDLGHDARAFGGVRLAAVGPKTAEALGKLGLYAEVVPAGEFNADALAAELVRLTPGARVLYPRAAQGRETLVKSLGRVAAVTAVTVYEQREVAINPDSPVYRALLRGEISVVLLGSANVARALVRSFDETLRGRVARGEVALIAISQAVASGLDLPVAAVAQSATGAGLVAAAVAWATSRPGGH